MKLVQKRAFEIIDVRTDFKPDHIKKVWTSFTAARQFMASLAVDNKPKDDPVVRERYLKVLLRLTTQILFLLHYI